MKEYLMKNYVGVLLIALFTGALALMGCGSSPVAKTSPEAKSGPLDAQKLIGTWKGEITNGSSTFYFQYRQGGNCFLVETTTETGAGHQTIESIWKINENNSAETGRFVTKLSADGNTLCVDFGGKVGSINFVKQQSSSLEGKWRIVEEEGVFKDFFFFGDMCVSIIHTGEIVDSDERIIRANFGTFTSTNDTLTQKRTSVNVLHNWMSDEGKGPITNWTYKISGNTLTLHNTTDAHEPDETYTQVE
jgi:hypothetical protein